MSEEQEQKNGAAEAVTTSNPEDFSLDRLKSHFETCIGEDNSINIDKYLLGKNLESVLLYFFRCWPLPLISLVIPLFLFFLSILCSFVWQK